MPQKNQLLYPSLLAAILLVGARESAGGQASTVPSISLQSELVAVLNGMVDKYRKLVFPLGQNWKELKIRKVTLVEADEQFMYVKFSVRIREINGLTDVVLYTLDGSARGRFHWGARASDRLCVAAPSGQGTALVVTETKDIPKINTPELARAAEIALMQNFPGEVCAPLWPGLRVSGTVAPEKTKGVYRHPPRPNKLVFTVVLSNPSARNVKVKFGTYDGSAKAGLDYKAKTGELLIPDGNKSMDIEVDIIPRDGNQGSRQMQLRLWSPVNGKIMDDTAVGVILDAGQTAPSGPIPARPL